MAHEMIPTDISTTTEVARLAHDVAEGGTRRALTEDGRASAVVTPATPPSTARAWANAVDA